MEPAGEAAQKHGLVNPLGAVETADEDLGEHVTECCVGAAVGPRGKTAELGSAKKALPFFGDDMDVAIGEQQQKNEFIRKAQLVQAAADFRYAGCGQQNHEKSGNGIGLEGDGQAQT